MTDDSEFLGDGSVHTSVDESDDLGQKFNVTSKSNNIDREIRTSEQVGKNSDYMVHRVDFNTLHEHAQNVIASAFLDTIAKDISALDFSIIDKETGDVDQEAMEKYKNMWRQRDARNAHEIITRDMSWSGNSFVVGETFVGEDEVGEIAIADPRTMKAVTNKYDIIENWVHRNRGSDTVKIDPERVGHFKSDSTSHTIYGRGSIEKSINIIQMADELSLKEVLQLQEGGPQGILSQTSSNDRNPMSSAEIEKLYNELHAKKGESQAFATAMGSWDFTSIEQDISELNVEEKYSRYIELIGAVFDVQPSYVGFHMSDQGGIGQGTRFKEEMNAYQQSGLKNMALNIQSTINSEVIDWINEDKDLKFKFDLPESGDNKNNFYADLATASKKLQEAGISHKIEDDRIIVEDEEIHPTDIPENPEDEKDIVDSEKDDKKQKLDNLKVNDRKREFLMNYYGNDFDITNEKEQFYDAMMDLYKTSLSFNQMYENVAECLSGTPSNDTIISWRDTVKETKSIQKDVDEQYLVDGKTEGFFIPNKGMYDACKQAVEWYEEHTDDIDAFGDDGEGIRRARQIIRDYEDDQALETEYWKEINAFMARHMAQGNHELDEEFQNEPWKDNGYLSHLAWGGDAAAEKAERVVEHIDEVENN